MIVETILTVRRAKALKDLGMRYLSMDKSGEAYASDARPYIDKEKFSRLWLVMTGDSKLEALNATILNNYYSGDWEQSLVDLNNYASAASHGAPKARGE